MFNSQKQNINKYYPPFRECIINNINGVNISYKSLNKKNKDKYKKENNKIYYNIFLNKSLYF
jgi:hypothetical protein